MIGEASKRILTLGPISDEPRLTDEQLMELAFNEKHLIINSAPGLLDELSARFLHSIAYFVLKHRSPSFMLDLIEFLRDREPDIVKECGDYAHFDLKRTIWSLELMRQDMVVNKPFEIFRVQAPDTQSWNKFINGLAADKKQWFSAVWFHAECYMFRRIWSIFQRSESLVNYDYFAENKIMAVEKAKELMKSILHSSRDLEPSKESFQRVLKLSLWGNRNEWMPDSRLYELLTEYEPNLLVDQSEAVWLDLKEAYDPVYVDIVCDNAGFEIFTDLVLADYIISSRLAQRVRFHVKAIPWYILDVTHKDFHWLLHFFSEHKFPEFRAFAKRIQQHLANRSFILCEKSYFWTSAHDFSQMKMVQPCLYVYLSEASLVICKGDFNYRKLLGDINHRSTDSFDSCLRGFQPATVCALRVIKTDICCGMSVCQVEWLKEDRPNWMLEGESGVIQVAVKHRLSGDIIV